MPDRVELLARLAHLRDGELGASATLKGREDLVRGLAAANRPRAIPMRALLAAMVTAMAIAIVVFAWPDGDLAYDVAGGVAEDGYVHAAAEPARITFSDGSTFALRQGSASRVVDVRDNGARILLEQGELAANVVPQSDAQWTVAAGPYAILVTGTQFTVTWEPEAQRFAVQLTEGSITVRGPMAEPGLHMQAGQQLVAHVTERDLQLTEGAATADAATAAARSAKADSSTDSKSSAPEAASSDAAADTTPSASAAVPVAAAEPTAPVSWSKLIADGEYKQVMTLARGMGIDSVLSSGSLEKLVALGDAARYTGDGATSRKVLVSMRERFPSSSGAKTAAFLLGRMAEGGSPSGAITWYDRYLAESPSGTYASEALGRKLVLLSRSQPARARAVARQYLQLYPKGGYANVARKLTQP